jgi:hypothetical protein
MPARLNHTVGRMQHAEMVDAILDGQGDGLAPAFDRYAPALYGYCRILLGGPGAAGDAVQDTFIIAAGALGRLRDPARLRPVQGPICAINLSVKRRRGLP